MIGLVGRPIKHSHSPFIHKQLHEVPYQLFENVRLTDALKHPSLQGLNVTYPYKHDAFTVCDLLDETAQKTGVVNTIVKEGEYLKGYNTDALALAQILQTHGFNFRDRNVAILGNGATMKSARYALAFHGFKHVKVYARNPGLKEYALDELPKDIHILINTTPVGMVKHDERLPLNLAQFPKLLWVIDVVNAPLRTPLILEAQARQIKTTTGLTMLVRQAVLGAEKMLARSFEHINLQALYQKTLQHTENIVLIGMPYSGKSTLAKAVAKALNRPLYDLDDLLVEHFKMPIPKVFETHGEAAFREAETALIRDLAYHQGVVIATGGGAILNPENVPLLKRNGVLMWLQAPPPTSYLTSRPLSSNKVAYDALKKDRWPRYQAVADVIISRQEDPKETLKEWERATHAYYDSKRP